ncbi:MAG: endo-1,4-beta-xylanase [Ruminococcus sp.]
MSMCRPATPALPRTGSHELLHGRCCGRTPADCDQDDIASLKDAYSDYFKIGCACAGSEFAQGATKDLIKKHYNSLTLGNELKPDSVLDLALSQKYVAETGDDTMPQISLNEADEMLKFAGENKIPVRGHVLVWHSQTPDWFFKENFDPTGMGFQGQDDQASGKLHQDRHGNAGKGLSGCGILRMGRGERGCLRCRNHS